MSEADEKPQPKLVQSLMEIPLAPDTYAADLAVTDRYQQFSAEIIRLCLGGIGVFGFVLKEVVLSKDSGGKYAAAFSKASWCFSSGLVALAISAGFALAHRYFASDCIGVQVRYLRARSLRDGIRQSAEPDSAEIAKHNLTMDDEKTELRKLLKRCESMLALAAAFLGIGIVLIAAGLAWTIF